MASTIASSVRSGVRENRQPSSPHTPSRFISSTFSSPGSTYRQEEDVVIIEIGSRYIRAGFEGEAEPQCTVSLGPEESRRVGDYRGWSTGRKTKDERLNKWGIEHEIWRMDLKDFDLGLFEDKLERVIRDIYNKYLLMDAGSARLVLVLPSVLPHPLLSSLLTTFFSRWKYSTATLLPAPTMAVVGAGLRSALIVDIGWHETIATAVCEYREISALRSTRAMKALSKALCRSLLKAKEMGKHGLDENTIVDFELVEELAARLAWCHKAPTHKSPGGADLTSQTANLSITAGKADMVSGNSPVAIEIDWPATTTSKYIQISREEFSSPVEDVFFLVETQSKKLDDDELSLPLLIFKALLSLPPDVRALCMSRIIFVGGGSNIPGLSSRALDEVEAIVEKYGWCGVRGSRLETERKTLNELNQGRTRPPNARHGTADSPGQDFVEEKVRKRADKDSQPQIKGVLRSVESLGSWSGASLLASLKIRGFVEVEREKFLSHGLNGAHRHMDTSVVPQRQSYVAGVLKSGGDRSSWTLAGWA